MTTPLGARRRALLAAAALALLAAAPATAQSSGAVAERATHLLQRATYGPRPGDVERVLSMGVEAWLDWQLRPDQIPDGAFEAVLADYPAATLPIPQMASTYVLPRLVPGGETGMGGDRSRFRHPREIVLELSMARLHRAIRSDRQLEAVMTDFWFNHFNVYALVGQPQLLVADYERTAIRPHVFGRFEDMLVATARHPAMLVYLDNFRSLTPDSSAPRGPGGINENYARELLELHTLGVEGGYTQSDIETVARAFTGWTIDRHPPAIPPGDGDDLDSRRFRRRYERARMDPDAGATVFLFLAERHDTGPKTVLGTPLAAGRGIEDGMDVLGMLSRHPSTARHVATKLAHAFVADDPPPALVERLAETFLRTDGDLGAVTRELFLSPEFADPAVHGRKVRSPFELVAAALRMTDAELEPRSRDLLLWLNAAGELPYAAQPPTGYPEAAEVWVNAGALLQRSELATSLVGGEIAGVRLDVPRLAAGTDPVGALLERLLPGRETGRLEAIVRSETAGLDPVAAAARAAALVLASPEFQTR
ncbi:MAG TPA: DUF1800 domain-containing protein [Gemmatimonadota bacterium]|nr:DUF1800 domain-containing protein [Gemmatimonadota bacterium]